MHLAGLFTMCFVVSKIAGYSMANLSVYHYLVMALGVVLVVYYYVNGGVPSADDMQKYA